MTIHHNTQLKFGLVEDDNDPQKCGRVRVRVYGVHPSDKTLLSTDELPWSSVAGNTEANKGVGTSPTNYKIGTTVYGEFVDGIDQQTFFVLGSVYGFDDDYNDVNRLARNIEIDQTIVKTKKSDIVSNDLFDEPETPYNAQYPHNTVHETTSGHIIELDSTPSSERIHAFHTSGTFIEVHPDGTIVKKSKNNNFVLITNDDNVHVGGNRNVYISGNCTVYIDGDCTQHIKGDVVQKIDGDASQTIGGDCSQNIDGDCSQNISGNKTEDVSGSLKISAGGNIDISSGAQFNVSAIKINLN